MFRMSLAGLRAHLLRLLLTAIAIVLGVGFIAGTFVLTDSMEAGVDKKFARSAAKVDVAVLAPDSSDEPRLPVGLADRIRALPGVADVQGTVRGDAPLIGGDGKAYGDFPTLGLSVPRGGLLRYEFPRGRPPAGPGEAVLDEKTAERGGFRVGQTIKVLDHRGAAHAFTLVGLADYGIDPDVAVRGGVGFETGTAFKMTGVQGYEEIDVRAGPGVTGLRDTVAKAVGPSHRVLTGERLGEILARSAGADTKIIRAGLLLFGLVSLLVSALVIYNTFSILVAQRTREMALLRCVGATRRQVFGGVLIESAAVGLAGSLLGLAAGLGLGAGMLSLVGSLGTGVATGTIALNPRTVVLGLVVGVAVTMLSALLPARTATRVAPVAALRAEPEPGTGRFRLGRARVALVVVFGGTGLALGATASLFMEKGVASMYVVAVSGVPVFLAVIALMPVLVRPLSRLTGAVFARPAGVPGRLAVQNACRAPRRTATTTIALTVGVGLMTLFSVIAAGSKATAERQIAEQFPVDYQLTTQLGSDQLIPRALGAELRRRPELASVTEVRERRTAVEGEQYGVGTITRAALGGLVKPEVDSGSLAALTGGTAAVHQALADREGWRVGRTVAVRTDRGAVRLKIVATFHGDTPLSPLLVPEADFDRYFGAPGDKAIYIVARPDVRPAAARAAVEAVARPYPAVKVGSAAELKEQLGGAIDTVLLIFAGLLGLAIVIALFGIANTLTLSVVERTRESALLRALGITRRQLRLMLSVEALIMAVIGALTGVVLGVVFGWAATNTIAESFVFVLPHLQIAGFVLLAGLAGVLAGVLPARRAAKASIVESLAHE